MGTISTDTYFRASPPTYQSEAIQIDYKRATQVVFKALQENFISNNALSLVKISKFLPLTALSSTLSTISVTIYVLFQTVALLTIWRKAQLAPKSYFQGIFQEAYALFLISLSYHVKRQNEPVSNPSAVPILMVHGFMHDSSAWLFYKEELKSEVGPIYTIDLGSPFQTIENYADLIQQKVSKMQKETGRKDIILIGHSMGGLAISTFAERETCDVKAILTLGSPFRGTGLARPIKGSPCVQQMRPNSQFVKDLHEDFRSSHIPTEHIACRCDVIVPYPSSFPTKDSNVTYTLLDDGGHCSLLFSKYVANRIREIHKNALQQ